MFDLSALIRAVEVHQRVARLVIVAHNGSSPRETGTAMLLWQDGQDGTIGGGALEHEASLRARAMLAAGGIRLDRSALGPTLGQCCGGAVTVLTEIYDKANLPTPEAGMIFRTTDICNTGPMPLAVQRLISRARAQGGISQPVLLQGWFVEPLARPTRHLWIWGAGHVGRALVHTLSPLSDLAITWVDIVADRFPLTLPDNVTQLTAQNPVDLVAHAPQDAEHMILTFSHALDLDLCHRLLTHGFVRVGLIGSHTKWARFWSRLVALGHSPSSIARIDCPIGDPSLGKHPQAIAIGVAAAFLNQKNNMSRQENAV
ncbi:MAG: xanthine dehydrogenase accessory protein XdhC [Rhodobacteraceae bacterium]|nr:xanthine dehydrogenase accessory protein XdhC [Paracoccaceae bacterium]